MTKKVAYILLTFYNMLITKENNLLLNSLLYNTNFTMFLFQVKLTLFPRETPI